MTRGCLLILILAMSLVACGGGGGGSDTEEKLDYTQACRALFWPDEQVEALERLQIKGIEEPLLEQVDDPSADSELYVEARASDQPDAPFLPLPAFIHEDDDGVYLTVPAPLNIDDPYADQEFDLTLVAGEARCQGPVVEVHGIRHGTGDEIDDYIDETEQALVSEAEPFFSGVIYDDLLVHRTKLLEDAVMPPLPLLGVLIAVDALEDFKEDVQELNGEDRELLEAYMAHLGFIGAMQKRMAASMLLPPVSQSSGRSLGATSAGSVNPAAIPAMVPRAMGGGSPIIATRSVCTSIQGDPVEIDYPEALQRYMIQQKNAEDTLSGASGAMREAAMAGIPIIGAVIGGPAAAAVGTGASLLLYIEYTMNAYSRDTLPSGFKHLDINLVPGVNIPEDYEKAGETAMWGNAEVTAESNGHDLTEAAVRALAQALGAIRYVRSLGKPAAVTFGTKAANAATRFAQNKVFQKISDLAQGTSECLSVSPAEWTVEVSDERWTSSRLVGEGRAVELGDREPLYQKLDLKEIGTAHLVVEINDEEFAGRTVSTDHLLQVSELQLAWEPTAQHIDTPGSEHDFTITVSNAERDDSELTPDILPGDGATLVSGPTSIGDGKFEVRLQSPVDPEDYPVTIEASLPAVLSPMTDRVGDVVLFSERRIHVDPRAACVKKNDSLELTAELSGFSPGESVNWTVSGLGSIGSVNTTEEQSTARFQAAGSEGEALVTVTAAGDADVFSQARISVGACDSRMHVWGALDVSASAGSDSSSYNSTRDAGVVMEESVPPPEVPSQFWRGRQEHFESRKFASDVIDDVGAVSATAQGSVDLISDADGGIVYQHASNTLQDECWVDPDDSNSVDCASAMTMGGTAVSYYLDLDEPMRLEISIEGECYSESNARLRLSVSGVISQFAGSGKDPVPPGGGPSDPSGFIHPNLFQDEDFMPGLIVGAPGVPGVPGFTEVCENGTYTYHRELDLAGPVNPGETDLVILTFSTTSSLSLINNTASPRQPGRFDGEGEFKYSIKVQQR